MKTGFTAVLLFCCSLVTAQWSDTQNQFYDSLHMPVCRAAGEQRNPIVLSSYPDGGFFVIWEDDRNSATTKTDIYAQKYDRNGNALWAVDGVPVANGPNSQRYTASGVDYRHYSFAATDSAGGFYLTYVDDSVSNYYWERVTVQHLRSNGTQVFPGEGRVVDRSGAPNGVMFPQLIADGKKGFFVAYKQYAGNEYVQAYCFRDENGALLSFGGGKMNENVKQVNSLGACGIRTSLEYPGTNVSSFFIWSDQQGGCNVLMNLYGNTGGQGNMLCINRLWRAKQASVSRTLRRNNTGVACPKFTVYKKDTVYILYQVKTDFQDAYCGGGGGPVYTYTNYRVLSNGYQVIDITGYDYSALKAVTVFPPQGNIAVDFIAATTRKLTGNQVSNFYVQGYTLLAEKFDSIPYQATSYNNPEIGYNPVIPSRLEKMNYFRDTVLALSNYYPDFTIAAGNRDIYLAGNFSTQLGGRDIKLQKISVTRMGGDSLSVYYDTMPGQAVSRSGNLIGRELSTGFGGSDMYFDQPRVKINRNNDATLYIQEAGRSVRVSPIIIGTQLGWGAMGKPIGTNYFNNSGYSLETPAMDIDSLGASGVIAWKDGRVGQGNTGSNIFMRYINRLNVFNYTPAPKQVQRMSTLFTPSFANPAVWLGSSRRYSALEVFTANGGMNYTPVANVLDEHNLNRMQASVYQHSGNIRRYNGTPYLDRNFSIIPELDASGKQIDLQLLITYDEFNALRNADNSIADPSFLSVVRQASTNVYATSTYNPVAEEEAVTPVRWDSVAGGLSLQIRVNGLGHFFIRKIPTTTLCATASASFISNINGGSYQWQVDNGTGFSPISEGGSYSGSNTANLQINPVPSSLNGYRYRCLVNGTTFSNTFYLQVATTWSGALDNQWENPANWNCGTVPDSNTDVIVTSGNVTVNSNVSCRSLKVNPGATVTVSPGFNLTVTH